MRGELPTCKRCCCCMPLRYGLLFWSYFKLIIFTLFLIPISYTLETCILFEFDTIEIMITAFALILNIAEVIQMILFIVAAHRKNYKIMNVCCYYSCITTVVFALLWTSYMILEVMSYYRYGYLYAYYWPRILFTMTFGLIYIVLQVYVILLARSEAAKLRDNCRFVFTNNGAEAECALNVHPD